MKIFLFVIAAFTSVDVFASVEDYPAYVVCRNTNPNSKSAIIAHYGIMPKNQSQAKATARCYSGTTIDVTGQYTSADDAGLIALSTWLKNDNSQGSLMTVSGSFGKNQDFKFEEYIGGVKTLDTWTGELVVMDPTLPKLDPICVAEVEAEALKAAGEGFALKSTEFESRLVYRNHIHPRDQFQVTVYSANASRVYTVGAYVFYKYGGGIGECTAHVIGLPR